jgi:glycosyltransferase involved in cell wall biosynthesis
VTLTGFIDFDEWACILAQADVGFNASFPEALIYFPNKIFYYLAAGAAVLNTIPGQCARLVAEHACGLNYTAGDVDGCFAAIAALVEDAERRRAMGAQSRRLAEAVFDRRIVYADMARFLERVGREGKVQNEK